jgi:O-antigen/teichoic acid export membrane protein
MKNIQHIKNRLKQSSLFKDSLWALVGSVLANALSLIAGIIVARFLGKNVFGEYGMLKTTLLEIAIFSTFGLGHAITKYIAQYKKQQPDKIPQLVRYSTFITLLISVSIALLVFIVANPLSIFLKTPHLTGMLRLAAIAIIFNAITTTQTGVLAGFAAFKTIVVNKFISGIIVFLFSVVLTYFYRLEGAVVALIISLFCNAAINFISVRKILNQYKTIPVVDKKLNQELLRFSLPIALQESCYAITYWGIACFIVSFSNYGELGIYNAAAQWQSIIAYIPSVLGNVMLSYFSESANETGKHGKMVNRMLLVSGLSTLMPFLFVLLFSKFIVSLYGSTFINMNMVLSVMMFTAVPSSLISVYTKEYISRGKNWFLFISRFVRDILIITTAIALLSLFPTESVAKLFAISILTCYTGYCLLLHIIYRRTILCKK